MVYCSVVAIWCSSYHINGTKKVCSKVAIVIMVQSTCVG